MIKQPDIFVGIMDREAEVTGRLEGTFGDELHRVSGSFCAKAEAGEIILIDQARRQIFRSPRIRLAAQQEGATFSIANVIIGNRFHWERAEDQTFGGNLILKIRDDGSMAVINEIPLENYLTSVISSEMNSEAPLEFLKAHAILSRSWLMASLEGKRNKGESLTPQEETPKGEGEVIRWYDREDHDLFDVCADDHCQRYQGLTTIASGNARKAVDETTGMVLMFEGRICDARYSKCCGGLTERYDSAWGNQEVHYLNSLSDSPVSHPPMETEEQAVAWILSEPAAYCNTRDDELLGRILRETDRETRDFFRWRVEYFPGELSDILKHKSGLDFGVLKEIIPLRRGPSGRIFRLRIIGSKLSLVVGKELEIRRWLSKTHLYSSAFIVKMTGDRITLHGAGWGHGVGLCQIGAAAMAARRFKAEEILRHYFNGIEITKIY
jgi:stage II sporulation protein D